jgi:uncharacterized protein YjbI with pentapeptide repeats
MLTHSLSARPLSYADLGGNDLSKKNAPATLSGAQLEGADLHGAFLRHANLSGAKLAGIKGVTAEQLKQQARSLKGATMLNGQKYEDWLKDQEAARRMGRTAAHHNGSQNKLRRTPCMRSLENCSPEQLGE